MDRRCLVVSYYFPPLGGGGVQRITKFIKYAARSGWRFTVLTADEQTNIAPDPSLLKEIPEDVQVVRVESGLGLPKTGSGRIIRSGFLRRWLSAALFIPDIRKKWLPAVERAVREELRKNDYHCVLVSIPPYSLAVLAARLSEDTDIPVILDMRDPWTQNPYKLHPTRWHYRRDLEIELNAVAKVGWGVSAYRRTIQFYRDNIPGFNPDRWAWIPNGFDEEDFRELKPEIHDDGRFHLGFSGTFYSHGNHPKFLFAAMAKIKKRDPRLGARLYFHHLGVSHIDLTKLAKKYDLTGQVISEGYWPHRQALNKLAGMNGLCFILSDRDPRSVNTVGGKVYEYLRLGKPILAMVPPNGEAAELIGETRSGRVVAPTDVARIASLLTEWLTKPPEVTPRNITQYSREFQAKQWIQFLERAIQSG
ncbi:MAG TPA: glycosyltransferase [Caldithrix abyssi]|uniref:Glycosyltransferase n=1 Tax=Caldithrix abyssi TaxID=187145 RepID=A0A7V5PPG0_CALAY|nr:glycosyltransferase [Caldithrix abyssi]